MPHPVDVVFTLETVLTYTDMYSFVLINMRCFISGSWFGEFTELKLCGAFAYSLF